MGLSPRPCADRPGGVVARAARGRDVALARFFGLSRRWALADGRDSASAVLRERRSAARDARRARGQHVGRPKALAPDKADLARRMHASGESAKTIAATLGVSAATVYRVVAED